VAVFSKQGDALGKILQRGFKQFGAVRHPCPSMRFIGGARLNLIVGIFVLWIGLVA
jgi:hypothetical protein